MQTDTSTDARPKNLESARQVLRENKTLTLATGSDKDLWAATMFYWSEGLDLYCVVKPGAKTLEHATQNPTGFVTIDRALPDRFVQAQVDIEVCGDLDANARVRDALIEKVPPILGFLRAMPGLQILRLRPSTLHVTDHSQGMSARVEIQPSDDERAAQPQDQRSRAKIWWLAARPFAFTATSISVFLGALIAVQQGQASLGMFALTLLAALLLHAGINMVSDVFDFKRGLDDWRTFGSSRMLVDGHLKAGSLLTVGLGLMALASALGLVVVALSGPIILWLGVAGIVGGLLYTGGGVLGFKYKALGDLTVFVFFGPLLTLGAYAAHTGRFDWKPVLISIPVAFLVDGILHANNLRDIEDDRRSGATTLASLLGIRGSQWFYVLLLVAAYASLIALVATQQIPVWSLLAVLTLPLALRNVRIIRQPSHPLFAAGDGLTAQLHMVFGLALCAGMLIGLWV